MKTMEEQLDTKNEQIVAVVIMLLTIIGIAFAITFAVKHKQIDTETTNGLQNNLLKLQERLTEAEQNINNKEQPMIIERKLMADQETIDEITHAVEQKINYREIINKTTVETHKEYNCVFVKMDYGAKLDCNFI